MRLLGLVIAVGLQGACGAPAGAPVAGERVEVTWRDDGGGALSCGWVYPKYVGHQFVALPRGQEEYGPVVRCPRVDGPVLVANVRRVAAYKRPFGLAAQLLWIVSWLAVLIAIWGVFQRDPFGLRRARDEFAALAASRSEDQQTSDGLPTLTPLHCASCSAPVPLLAGAETGSQTCPHCAGRVPVPDSYREPAAIRRQTQTVLRHAAVLWAACKKWSSPPRRFAVLVARVVVPVLFVAVVSAGASAGVVRGAFGLFSGFFVLLAIAFAIVGPRMLSGGDKALAEALVAVELPRADFADGGECRHCGAAVQAVSPADVVVDCMYCGTVHILSSRVERNRAVAAEQLRKAELALLRASAAHASKQYWKWRIIVWSAQAATVFASLSLVRQ